MDRRDAHRAALLRYLGAAYYESLKGRASASDVARALDTVEELTGEHPAKKAAGAGAPHSREAGDGGEGYLRHRQWRRRVRDVMTTSVVTVDRITPYKEIVSLLAEHNFSTVPVLEMGRHVAGVVSETDLIRVQEQHKPNARGGKRTALLWRRRSRPQGLTAAGLMTSPAITIHPDATIPAAARIMDTRRVRCLPVVDREGALVGIVSRRDLLSVFLRPDADIAADVRALFTHLLLTDAVKVGVTVKEGVVVLAGQVGELEQPDLIIIAKRLIWDIEGVVDVVNELAVPQPD